MTGFIVYLLDLPICWQVKSQKGVTSSSTEAKYVAISEAFKEVKFVCYLLCDLHIKVNLPIVVQTENIGAIYMSENASTDFRTQHVETFYHFVLDFKRVRSVRNNSDFLAKMLVRSYVKKEKHAKTFLEEIGDYSTS
jgi:hypothetical protein